MSERAWRARGVDKPVDGVGVLSNVLRGCEVAGGCGMVLWGRNVRSETKSGMGKSRLLGVQVAARALIW